MSKSQADLILKNAHVITMVNEQPSAEMVAVKDGRISFVGTNRDAAEFAGAGTKTIDCDGKTVLPGFIDTHCHLFGMMRESVSIDLGPTSVKSIEDIKRLLASRAQQIPRGKWISGRNYDEFRLREKRHPTRIDLDAVSPDNPVILTHRSQHACVLNSLGMKITHIDTNTPESPGAVIQRDVATGEPDGVLYNMVFEVLRKLPSPSGAELEREAAGASRELVSHGITSFHDASPNNDIKRWQLFGEFKNKEVVKSRIFMLLDVHKISSFVEAGLSHCSGNDDLRLGCVKIIVNGSTLGLVPSPDELAQRVLEAQRAGFPVAVHAIKPDAIDALLTALENAALHHPNPGLRHRVEHCSECPPYLLKRLVKLSIIVSTQPSFLYYSGDRYLASIPQSRLRWLYRIKSFYDAGLVVTGSSDAPVNVPDPLIGICAAATRKAGNGDVLMPTECVTVPQALAMYTINAAYASSEEKIKGSIAPGKLADFVILDANPLQIPACEIKNLKVIMTIVGGRVVWEH